MADRLLGVPSRRASVTAIDDEVIVDQAPAYPAGG
jgi:hypothetical protein